jgi:hypothetical protein
MPYFPEPGPLVEQLAPRVEERPLCHMSPSRDLAISDEPLAPVEERPPYALLLCFGVLSAVNKPGEIRACG